MATIFPLRCVLFSTHLLFRHALLAIPLIPLVDLLVIRSVLLLNSTRRSLLSLTLSFCPLDSPVFQPGDILSIPLYPCYSRRVAGGVDIGYLLNWT